MGVDRRTFIGRAAAVALAPGAVLRSERSRAVAGPLAELAAAVRGPVIAPGDARYARARLGYNPRFDANRPLAVVQPLDQNDVAAAIGWAARQGQRIAGRSGGHSYAGYSTPDSGLVVDLRRMRGVAVRGDVVRVGAGAQLIDVHSVLSARGLTLPTGSCPSVGVAGLTLGGGVGLSARHLGLTCDRLRAVEIVTADGTARRVTAVDEPDLFWALRGGGGGNFGIVTAFEFEPHASRGASWFTLRWPWSQADEVLAAWLAFAPQTDPRLTSILTLSAGAGLGVSVVGQFSGPEARLRRLIAPLMRVPGGRLGSGADSSMGLVRRWAGCLDRSTVACHTVGTRAGGSLPRNRFAAASGYVDRPLTGAQRRALLALVDGRRRQRAGGGALIFDAYGGAIRRIAQDATAFAHRTALCGVQAYAGFGAGGSAPAADWLARTRAILAGVGTGAYVNYIDPKLARWADAYYGANLDRLRDVRRRYDPAQLFTFAQAIP